MMKLIKYPSKEQWAELLKRPALNTESLFDTVRTIINKVRAEGDKAVLEYEAAFDKVTLSALTVTSEEIQKAEGLISDELKSAITLAKRNIPTLRWQEGRNNGRSNLLAKGGRYRKGGALYSRWNGSAFLYGIDVGCSRKNCGMQGNCALYPS